MRESIKLLCSTGIITHYPNFPDYKPIVRYGKEIPCEAFELMIFPDWYRDMENIIRDITEAGYNCPVTHADKVIGTLVSECEAVEYQKAIELVKENCDIAKKVGSKLKVLGEDEKTVAASCYLDCTLSACWSLEDGEGLEDIEAALAKIRWLGRYL